MVVGAGIGGLTTAVALRRRGIEVTVLERAGQLREIGAGLTLWPNAMRALRRVGLADAVAAAGAPALFGTLRSSSGAALLRPPFRELERRYGEPGIALLRGDLQRLLLDQVGGAVRLGTTCVGATQDKNGAAALLADGSRAEADLLIGADGLRSVVRASLFDDRPPRYAGYTAWRGVAPLPAETEGFESWGRGERFGMVPLGRGVAYWFGTANAP